MGYPMTAGYRYSAGAAAAGRSTSAAIDSAASMLSQPFTQAAANDLFSLLPRTPAPAPVPFAMPSIAARGLGLARVVPWLGTALTVYELYKLWNSTPLFGSGGVVNCSSGSGSGMFSGGTCLFPFHLTTAHTAPAVAGTGTAITMGPSHACNANGALFFGNPNRSTYRTWAGGTLWTAASALPRPKIYNWEVPYEIPRKLPRWAPAVNPWELPIKNPVPDFPPLPWPVIPHRTWPRPTGDPIGTPDRGPTPDTGPGTFPNPDTNPRTDPDPVPNHPGRPFPLPPLPRDRPSSSDLPRPGTATVLDPVIEVRQSDSPNHKRPPPRTVESKLQNRAATVVWVAAHVITESKDMVQAMWKALPKRFKTKQSKKKRDGARPGKFGERQTPPVTTMAKDVYRGIREMGVGQTENPYMQREAEAFWNKAVDNIIENLFQDYVFGKLGREVGKASRASGRPIGLGAGPAL